MIESIILLKNYRKARSTNSRKPPIIIIIVITNVRKYPSQNCKLEVIPQYINKINRIIITGIASVPILPVAINIEKLQQANPKRNPSLKVVFLGSSVFMESSLEDSCSISLESIFPNLSGIFFKFFDFFKMLDTV